MGVVWRIEVELARGKLMSVWGIRQRNVLQNSNIIVYFCFSDPSNLDFDKYLFPLSQIYRL